MQTEFAIPRLPPTDVRKRRLLMLFESKEAAYRWSDKKVPLSVKGSLGFLPPKAVNDKAAGGWVLKYTVQMGGHLKYFTLARNGRLV